MKDIKNMAIMLLVIAAVCLSSCKEDNDWDNNTPIQITQIYLEDYKSNTPDRPVDFGRLGQLIRLEGSGFIGVRKVYINGYDTYFNLAYVTDNSMLITINTNTPVVEAEEDVRDKIRLTKATGVEFTYPFIIRSAAPSVSHITNTLPKSGETVVVYGKNLQETTKVILPGEIEVTTGIESDEDGEWYSFVMPEGVTQSGSIISEGANGKSATPAYFNFTECMILDFDGIGTQGYWSWTETGSMINNEDLVADPVLSGRGNCVPMIPERLRTNGILAEKSRATECWTAGDDSDDWTRMYEYIPATTPLNEVAFQFDIYVPEAWSGTGQIEVALFNNFNFGGIGSDDDGQRTAFYVPYIENGAVVPFKTIGWQTVTIPFSQFGYYAEQIEDEEVAIKPTFQNVVDDRLAATYRNFGMGIVNSSFKHQGVEITASLFTTEIYTDNWRIVPYAEIEISDFPDEDGAVDEIVDETVTE